LDRRKLIAGMLLMAAGVSHRVGADGEWMKLHNGQDLSGWHVESGKLESWTARGEMISCIKPGGGYLARDEEYDDFELRLDYRLPPAGNSGIGLRFPRGGWPSTQGMEIQLLDDEAPQYKKLKPDQYNGSIYTHVAPKVKAAKPPGEWNHIEIRCQGPHVVIRLNGTEIQSANLDDYADSLGKGKIPLGKRPRKGLIGLQSHGDPVDFRNIEVRKL
jgi:hypothetical protein